MKLVQVEVTVRISVEVPDEQTPEQTEFWLNESGWCGDNLPDLIEADIARNGGGTGSCSGLDEDRLEARVIR